jgi:1,4-alpha-glucan branching enzyme
MAGQLALVLHAHLPDVREPQWRHSIEERWFFEALWECYLPLCDMLDRLARDRVAAQLTLSLSPPLIGMLRDAALGERFEEHLRRIDEVRRRAAASTDRHSLGEALDDLGGRIAQAGRSWRASDGDLLGRLMQHARAGRLEVITTGASHAFLPGWTPVAGVARSQLALGRQLLRCTTGSEGPGLWLPECGFDATVAQALTRLDVGYTVLDSHAFELARPAAPPSGAMRHEGVVYFARDRTSSAQVWSRRHGYPGDPLYREFHRDLSQQLSESLLRPFAPGTPTGLKCWAVTGLTEHKLPYRPQLAAQRAAEHARHFVEQRASQLRAADRDALVVAPYDAELFGHWWFEGPTFLEHVLRGVARHDGLETVALSHARARQQAVSGLPAASSWGRGGFAEPWMNEGNAALWRPLHHAHRRVVRALRAGTAPATTLASAARELLQLQASDWPFLIDQGSAAHYAQRRLALHQHNIDALLGDSSHPPSSDTVARLLLKPALEALDDATVCREVMS